MKKRQLYGIPFRGNLKNLRLILLLSFVLLFGFVLTVSAESNSQTTKANSLNNAAVVQQEKVITGTVTDEQGVSQCSE